MLVLAPIGVFLWQSDSDNFDENGVIKQSLRNAFEHFLQSESLTTKNVIEMLSMSLEFEKILGATAQQGQDLMSVPFFFQKKLVERRGLQTQVRWKAVLRVLETFLFNLWLHEWQSHQAVTPGRLTIHPAQIPNHFYCKPIQIIHIVHFRNRIRPSHGQLRPPSHQKVAIAGS